MTRSRYELYRGKRIKCWLRGRSCSIAYQFVASHINFKIDEGNYLCIVGENGSGKSTLMKTLLRLQKPLAGEIRFGEAGQTKEIGYLPQQTVVQKDFPASVQEIVISGFQKKSGFRPFYNREEKKQAEENMRRGRREHEADGNSGIQ